MAKKIDPNKPMFGETAFVGGKEVKWEPGYKEARAAAIELCNHFPTLDPERDFWIKMESARYDSLMHFQAIVIRLSGCQKIDDAMPRAYQFDPASVEPLYCNGQRAAFVYRNSAQGVFTTGEANEANCNVSYVYSTAEKRIFCRAVLLLVFKMLGINGQSIYSEVEAEEFKEHENRGKKVEKAFDETSFENLGAPAPVIMQEMDEEEPEAENFGSFNAETDEGLPPAMAKPETDEDVIGFDDPAFGADPKQERLAGIADLMKATQTIEKNVCEYYEKKNSKPAGSYKSIAELSESDLVELETTLHKKEQKQAKQAAADDTAFAQKVVEEARKNAANSPAPAKESEPAEQPTLLDEAFEEEDGPAVFTCKMTAPPEVLDLVGKTLEEIGADTLTSLFGRKNSKARKHIDPVMEAEIDMFLMAAKKSKKEA